MTQLLKVARGPYVPPPSPWTEQRVAHLARRWSQGVSAARIAAELGGGLSRTAVLAKVHRLGIGKLSPFGGGRRRHRNISKVAAALAAARSPGVSHLFRSRSVPGLVRYPRLYVDNPRIDADVPREQRCSILELSSKRCRWPVGDPTRCGFFFCGGKPLAGKPYCAAHCARAYRPPCREPRQSGRRSKF